MSRMLLLALLLFGFSGCSQRSGWGVFPWGQGTSERQRSRAVAHDPYPLNDIGPEVVGGRPREFFNPLAEPKRAQLGPQQLPPSFNYPQR